MMAEMKKTKRVFYNELLEVVKGNVELENFLNHELELLDKKASNKTPSKVQVANENIKDKIVATLVELAKPSTISDIQSANVELGELSNQKISALLTQLVKTDAIVRIVDKKKAYFSVKSE